MTSRGSTHGVSQRGAHPLIQPRTGLMHSTWMCRVFTTNPVWVLYRALLEQACPSRCGSESTFACTARVSQTMTLSKVCSPYVVGLACSVATPQLNTRQQHGPATHRRCSFLIRLWLTQPFDWTIVGGTDWPILCLSLWWRKALRSKSLSSCFQ